MLTRVSVHGPGGMPLPPENLNLDPLRLVLTQSGTNFPNSILMTHTYLCPVIILMAPQ